MEGVAVAKVNDKLQLQAVEIWFDPQTMFTQMVEGTPDGTKGVGILSQPVSDEVLQASDARAEAATCPVGGH